MSEELYETLLNRKEVADILRVSPRTVRKLEKQGKIPRVELSGVGIRYRPSSIQAFIEGREVYIRPER